MEPQSRKLFVVSETHWDREWYRPFQEFRIQLVDLFDHLLRLMAETQRYWCYMADGQIITLEDYLEIRPERREEVVRLAREGRLQVGPFYVLADEYLATPEAYVRNLMLGVRRCAEFGGHMPVAYVPDQFGHLGQGPQIMRSFGLEYAFFMRGADPQLGNAADFIWEAPDGSWVQAANYVYGNAALLPEDLDEAVQRVEAIAAAEGPRAATDALLLMNGSDHLEPQDHLPAVMDAVNERTPHHMVHSTLQAYFEHVRAQNPDLPRTVGEQRYNVICDPIVDLYGCMSSRMYLKIAHHETAQELEQWGEPLCTAAYLLTGTYPQALLNKAWEYQLQNLPHDSICGCSPDRVHDQMLTRFQWAAEIANKHCYRAMATVAAKLNTAAMPEGSVPLVTFCPGPARQGQVVFAQPDLGEGDPADWEVVTAEGEALPTQVVPADLADDLRLVDHAVLGQLDQITDRPMLAFDPGRLPAMGCRAFAARRGADRKRRTPLRTDGRVLENAHLRVKVNADGTFDLTHKASKRSFKRLGALEDGGDVGGGYHYVAPQKDQILTTAGGAADVTVVADGPALGILRVEQTLEVPAALNKSRTARSRRTAKVRLRTYLMLSAHGRRLEITTVVDNRAVDHRLRALFPTKLKTDTAQVDGHFELLQRSVKAGEKPWPTEPQRRFVWLADETGGLAVLNYGLPEYEVFDDKSRTIALTLMRSNTYVTKTWWPSLRSPRQEMRGESVFRYAVMPTVPQAPAAEVYGEALAFNVPPRTIATTRHEGGPVTEGSLVEVSGPAQISALKKAEDRASVILRLYNPLDEPVPTTVKLALPLRAAHYATLGEDLQESIPVAEDGTLSLEIPKKRIVTLDLEVAK